MGNTHTTKQEREIHTCFWTSDPGHPAAVDPPVLSFTAKDFVFEYLRGVRSQHLCDTDKRPFLEDALYQPSSNGTTAEDMYDEMIKAGISPLGWAQANMPEVMLKGSFITRVPPDEDEEPNLNYNGMSFSHHAFLAILKLATSELRQAIPSAHPTVDRPIPDRYALPCRSCVAMYRLADMLDEMHDAGISPHQYVAQTTMLLSLSPTSPFMVCMQLSAELPELRKAIRDHWVVLYMMKCLERVWKHVDDPANHPLVHLFVQIPILSEPIWFAHVRPIIIQCKRDFVRSLPEIDITTISKADMRCPHCWCDFDEEDGDGQKDGPVHAPCPFGHVYGRSCLLTLMLHMEQTMLCPLCRQEWHI